MDVKEQLQIENLYGIEKENAISEYKNFNEQNYQNNSEHFRL